MERLTREMTFEEEYTFLKKEAKELFDKEEKESEPPERHCVVRRALRCIKKLVAEVEPYKAYKDLEEQGLLLRLPCKVGDIVYSINHNEKHEVTPVIVVEIKFSATGLTNKPYTKIICSDSDLRTKGCKEYNGDDFGKAIFLTQEEAEQKLKEMESD